MTGTAGLRPGGQRAGHWPHGQTSSWGPSPKTEEWELSIYSRKIGEICFVSGKGLKCLRHWAALGRIWGCAVCVAQARGLSPLGAERECRCRGVRAQQPPLEAPPSGVPLGLSLWTWLGDMMRDLSPSPMPVLRLSGPVEGDPRWPLEVVQRGTERGRLPPLVSRGSRWPLLGGTGLTQCIFREHPGSCRHRPHLTLSETFVLTVLRQSAIFRKSAGGPQRLRSESHPTS